MLLWLAHKFTTYFFCESKRKPQSPCFLGLTIILRKVMLLNVTFCSFLIQKVTIKIGSYENANTKREKLLKGGVEQHYSSWHYIQTR